MKRTGYNELMRKALFIAREQGVTEQAELNEIVYKVFREDAEACESEEKRA